ncbi:MAG: protein-L-isoaspartate(D-aspartate) O-methyltransferase [Verrucomicrobiota bacterium]
MSCSIRRQLFLLNVAILGLSAEPNDMKPHQPEDRHLELRRSELLKALEKKPYLITSEQVLKSIASVPREEFMLKANRQHAYENMPMPIRFGQTISQPYIVAFMTEKLEPKETDRVLEIGTGSGYQAAVLSPLVEHVYTVEIVPQLAEESAQKLKDLGYDNVSVRSGNGYEGWSENAPYDSIIVTCAPSSIPQPLIDQLRDGGRMVIPVGDFGNQRLVVLEKKNGKVTRKETLKVLFVPMTGEPKP